MNYSPLGSSVHGILQARILEWVAMSSSKGSSQPRGQTGVLCLPGWQADSLLLSYLGRPYSCNVYLLGRKEHAGQILVTAEIGARANETLHFLLLYHTRFGFSFYFMLEM